VANVFDSPIAIELAEEGAERENRENKNVHSFLPLYAE
jgi:hypothetical protein